MESDHLSGQGWGMARHQWRETGDDGMRYYRAVYHGGRWTISSQLKDEEEWTPHDPPDLELWRNLRDVLWRKYQRKRCPWKMVEEIDKLLEGEEGGAKTE